MSQNYQQHQQIPQPNYKQIAQKLTDFVNTPTPTNATDYKHVCEVLLKQIDITFIFGALLVVPTSFSIISTAILKIFGSSLGSELIRNQNVLKWLISGLQQSSNPEYEKLNILSINVLHSAFQSDKDIEYWIVNNNSTLFLWSLSLISSPFESSFQILEKIIIKHSSNPLLLKTLFSKNIIQMLLTTKDRNKNDNINQIDKGTIKFRGHALWIGALNQYYKHTKTEEKTQENVIEMYIESGLFADLLTLLQSDDILIQINVLPLLATLSNFERGLFLLLGENIIDIFTNLLKSEYAILFGKEIYKVLVAMIRNTNIIFNNTNNNKIVGWLDNKILFEIINLGFQSNDVCVKESCCLFLGLFCSFPKILKTFIILKQNNNNIAVTKLCEFVNILEVHPSVENKTLAIAAIHALCDIFGVQSEEKEIYEFEHGLLRELGGMERLFSFLKHPDDEMRFGVFRLINNICKQKWGIALVNNVGGMFEYLTDRNDADIMLGFEWKYTILESIFKNKNSNNVLDQTHKQQLKKYIQQGVVFNSDESKNKNKKNETVVQLGWERY